MHQIKDCFITEALGIFNWALAGLTRYRIDGSSVLSFVEDCCVLDARRQVSAAQLYHGYQQYSGGSGLRPVSQKRFWMELKESFGMVEREKDSLSRRSI